MTYRSKVAVVYLLGFFLDLINLFIASVAFPAMSVDLHTSISALAWVSNGYIAGLTLIVPFSAFLSRYLGARRLIIFSLILFSVAAAAAGFADSLHSLVFWRIVQGAGGGLLIPVGQALTWQQFKPHERAGVSSVVMMVALLAPACSPAIGGLLVETCGWRWIFFATLPVAGSHLIARLSLVERRVDDNGVSKIAPSAAVDGQAAAFCHDRLSVRTGYVHWYQRGRDVLSTERRAAIACGGGVADDPLVDRFICRHYAYRTLLQSAWAASADYRRLSSSGRRDTAFN